MSGAMLGSGKRADGTKYKYPVYRCRGAYPNRRCENRKVANEHTLEKYILENIKPLIRDYLVEYEVKTAPVTDNRRGAPRFSKRLTG